MINFTYFYDGAKFYDKYNFGNSIRVKEHENEDYLETIKTPKGNTLVSFYYDFFDILSFA